MGAADAPAGAHEASLSRVDECDDGSAADCSAASLALVLHRGGGVAAVADALASPPAVGGGVNGLGIETDAAASLRGLLNATVPGLECAPALRCRDSHGCSNTLAPRAGGARLAPC